MTRTERRTRPQCPARQAPARAQTLVRTLAGVLLLGPCACNRSRDKVADAASARVAEPAVAADAAATEPAPAAQTIRLVPGQAIGRIRVGMSLAELEGLTSDWSKEQLDSETLSLRMSPFHVLVTAGVATEVAFTLEPNILPLVGNTGVRDTSRATEVAKLFPDCQAPSVTDGVQRVSCQAGRTLVEKKQNGGNVEIRFVALPAAAGK